MPALITTIIPITSYERVRDRIGEILLTELAGQLALGLLEAETIVTVEGNGIVDNTEMTKTIVSLDQGIYQNQHTGERTAPYRFNIDMFCKAKSATGVDGSVKSIFKAQRLAGVISSILSNPLYRTLGFTAPFISRVLVFGIKIGEVDDKDALNTVGARLMLDVWVNEKEAMAVPTLIQGYQTNVTLGTSTNQYIYNPIP